MLVFVLICRELAGAPNYLTLLAVLWLQVHWMGIPRIAAQYSFMVDPAAVFFAAVLTYLVFARKPGMLVISCAVVGTVFKESVVLWCACLAFGLTVDALRRKQFDGMIGWVASACAGAFAVSAACKTVFLSADRSSGLNTLGLWAHLRALAWGFHGDSVGAVCHSRRKVL